MRTFSKRDDGTILVVNQRRERQPFYGLLGLFGGALLNGESFEDCAARSTLNETKLTAKFKLIGLSRSITFYDNEVFQDILFGICIADKHTGKLQNTTYGTNKWVSIDDAIKNESNVNTPNLKAVECLQLIKSGKDLNKIPFFYDIQSHHLSSLDI